MPNEQVKEENLNKVLKIAYEQYLERGIEGTTQEMLVRESGLSRASIDRYFKGKLDCVLHTAEWFGHHIFHDNEKLVEWISSGNIRGFKC